MCQIKIIDESEGSPSDVPIEDAPRSGVRWAWAAIAAAAVGLAGVISLVAD